MARRKQNSAATLPHGRKRTVSPGFFSDATLLTMPPLYRLFFEGLWCWADKAGRLLDRPIDLKIRILPNDQIDPHAALETFARRGLVARYRAGDGDAALQVIALKPGPWKEIQRIHPDEPDSALPPPPPGAFRVFDHANRPEGGIPDHGNWAEAPISGSGPSGLRDLRDPRDLRAFGPTGPSIGSADDRDRERPKRAKPVQAELPGTPPPPPKPPRAKSAAEEAYELFESCRRYELVDTLGLEFVPDDTPAPAFVNKALGPVLEITRRYDRGETSGFERLIDLYLEQPWAAEKSPPFPFRSFVGGLQDRPSKHEGGAAMKGLLTIFAEQNAWLLDATPPAPTGEPA